MGIVPARRKSVIRQQSASACLIFRFPPARSDGFFLSAEPAFVIFPVNHRLFIITPKRTVVNEVAFAVNVTLDHAAFIFHFSEKIRTYRTPLLFRNNGRDGFLPHAGRKYQNKEKKQKKRIIPEHTAPAAKYVKTVRIFPGKTDICLASGKDF